MRILLWHIHGAWTTAFVHGAHEYIVPVLPGRGPDGRGRAQTYAWPDAARELTPQQLADAGPDVVIVQRPRELALVERWLGLRPGRDVPAIYVEHNAPQGRIVEMHHPLADRDDLVIAHVTNFNDLFWDCGTTRTCVIEHGIVDPGYRFSGELPRAVVVINEPGRRGRVTGTDLIPLVTDGVDFDLYGMGAEDVGGRSDLPQDQLHDEMARRRVYVHPNRWTSLGLSLIEAMHLGLPVVALATTEVMEAVPSEAGVVSTRVETLRDAVRRLANDADEARERGEAGREAALGRFGLARFHTDWDALLGEVAA